MKAGPDGIIWDITYACPLRCTHCYSESGRRPARQLSHDDLLRVTDALISVGTEMVTLAGGEPLVVPGLFDVIDRFREGGVQVIVYTGGWSLRPETARALLTKCTQVNVSVDGATAEVHDRIRGRDGSFDRAMAALRLLDETAHQLDEHAEFGLDHTVTRSSFGQLDEYCGALAARFPGLGFIALGVAMPIGLASRPGFVDIELLHDQQADQLVSAEYKRYLRSLTPASVRLQVSDNRKLRYHPDLLAAGCIPAMQVEPDGRVRAMAIYEGTVGSLLIDTPWEIWQRSVERWNDPFVVSTLTPVHTMRQWAEATRAIDLRFGTADDQTRIGARPEFLPLTVAPSQGHFRRVS